LDESAIIRLYVYLSLAQLRAAEAAQAAAGPDPWPGAKHADFAAGEAIGRAVAARVLTFAQTLHHR
jgi:hypothetical protein